MYKISIYSEKISQKSHIIQLLYRIKDPDLIWVKEIFCDQNQDLINTHNPILNTSLMMSQDKLILSDVSCYNIANIFRTNNFICIDSNKHTNIPNLDNVQFVAFEDFKDEDTSQKLKEILQVDKYEKYKI